MEIGDKSIYDGQFRGNILVVGKTGCGKTYFLQKLGLNNFFGKLVKTEWVTGIETDEQREADIESCFSNNVEFHLAPEPNELVLLLKIFKLRTRDITNNNIILLLEKKFQWIVLLLWSTSVVDNCIDVFHIIMRENQIWKNNLSQVNIFNIFPLSVLYNTIAKIL